MNELINRIASERVRHHITYVFWKTRLVLFPSARRPFKAGETSKARERRLREGFFERYCAGKGIDIGYGGDPFIADCDVWDTEHGDAQYVRGLEESSYEVVYSSHVLEHVQNPALSLQNWWRLVRTGGYLILYLPDRDLYEKKTTLPSRWNKNHKRFFLLDRDEQPDTLGLVPLIKRVLVHFEIVYARQCREGHTITDPLLHSDGEYSIEVVVQKHR